MFYFYLLFNDCQSWLLSLNSVILSERLQSDKMVNASMLHFCTVFNSEKKVTVREEVR